MTKEEITQLYNNKMTLGDIKEQGVLDFGNCRLKLHEDKWYLSYYKGDEEEIVLWDGIEGIESYVFSQNKVLKKIYGENVADIEHNAFEWSGVQKVEFPNLTEIQTKVFSECSDLVTFIARRVIKIGERAFLNCYNLSDLQLGTLISIEEAAFYYCIALKELPDIESFSDKKQSEADHLGHQFACCFGLTELNNDKIKCIPPRAFKSCKNIRSISFGSVEAVGKQSFNFCNSLKDVNLPKVKFVAPDSFGHTAVGVLELKSLV